MTELAAGSRLDAIEKWKKVNNVELVYFSETDRRGFDEIEHEFVMSWSTTSLERKVLVYIAPPNFIEPSGIKPRKDRHVIFDTDRPPAAWKAWAKRNETTVQVVEYGRDPEQLIGHLVLGSGNLPKFTPEAARHLVSCNPGGRWALEWPIQQIKAMEYPEPISLEDAMEAWPFVVVKGKVYAVNLGHLIRTLGTEKAISLVSTAPEKESYGALKGLQVACQSQSDRLQWLNSLLKGVDEKKWTPKAALVLFTHLCLIEKKGARWPSNGTENTSFSPALTRLYQLCGIP